MHEYVILYKRFHSENFKQHLSSGIFYSQEDAKAKMRQLIAECPDLLFKVALKRKETPSWKKRGKSQRLR